MEPSLTGRDQECVTLEQPREDESRAGTEYARSVIDLHSHILPGLDDAAGNIHDSLAIARALVEDGVSLVAGTPHVRDDYRTTPDAMESALAAVRAAASEAEIELEICGGAEIALEQLDVLGVESLRRFGLGGQP